MSVLTYKFFNVAHCSGVNFSGMSGRDRCTGCKSASAFWIRIKFVSLKRQQTSTSRVTRVAPCATAANPPTRTNSTFPAISLRKSSARFCMTFFHRSAKGFREVQRIIVGKHALPRRHRETVTQQGDIHLPAFLVCWNDFGRERFSQLLSLFVGFFRRHFDSRVNRNAACEGR